MVPKPEIAAILDLIPDRLRASILHTGARLLSENVSVDDLSADWVVEAHHAMSVAMYGGPWVPGLWAAWQVIARFGGAK